MDIDAFLIRETHDLQGKSALVTGASAGIGLATACQLAAEGVNLKLIARRETRLQAIQAALTTRFPNIQVLYHVADLAEHDCFETLAQAGFFDVDILINNAGLAKGKDPVSASRFEDWQAMIDVNITACFEVTRRVLSGMLAQGQGDIVLLGSVAGHIAYEGGSVYCASKYALRAFAQSLRRETCGQNLRVKLISPGMVQTEFTTHRLGSEDAAASVYAGMTPLTPADIAQHIVFSLKQGRHVNWDELVIMAMAQGGVEKVVRQDD